MKTAIESAIDAMNAKTWNGNSIIELVRKGVIVKERFDALSEELLAERQLEFLEDGLPLEVIFSESDKFKAKCVEIMRLNA